LWLPTSWAKTLICDPTSAGLAVPINVGRLFRVTWSVCEMPVSFVTVGSRLTVGAAGVVVSMTMSGASTAGWLWLPATCVCVAVTRYGPSGVGLWAVIR